MDPSPAAAAPEAHFRFRAVSGGGLLTERNLERDQARVGEGGLRRRTEAYVYT